MSRVHVRPSARTRKLRWRRRVITLLAYVLVVFVLAWYFESQGTTTIVFVRHADVDQPNVLADQSLNAAGLARAEKLADVLENIDVVAGPDAIYVSPLRQSRETAGPLAKRTGLAIAEADPYDVVGFMRDVLSEHKREIILIVTQADAIAPLVEELHGSKNLAAFAPREYNRLTIVTIPWFGKVKTLELPYSDDSLRLTYSTDPSLPQVE